MDVDYLANRHAVITRTTELTANVHREWIGMRRETKPKLLDRLCEALRTLY